VNLHVLLIFFKLLNNSAKQLKLWDPDSLELDSMEPDIGEPDALDLYAGSEVLCRNLLILAPLS
jgi:hypothetical protein